MRRVHVDYPIAIDRVLGLGELPTVRLQHRLARVGPEGPRWRTLDKVLVWAHWSWFMVPHGALVYIMLRDPERFDRAAMMTYAVFDIGAMIYWVLPTAPPVVCGVGAGERPGPGRGRSCPDAEATGRCQYRPPDDRGAADDGRVRGVVLA